MTEQMHGDNEIYSRPTVTKNGGPAFLSNIYKKEDKL